MGEGLKRAVAAARATRRFAMTAKRSKPKFRVGQVVRVKREIILRFKIQTMNWQGRWYYWPPDTSIGYAEDELRPLTAREIGPSAAGKRRRGAK